MKLNLPYVELMKKVLLKKQAIKQIDAMSLRDLQKIDIRQNPIPFTREISNKRPVKTS